MAFHDGLRSKGLRMRAPKRMPMPRAVLWGRTLAPLVLASAESRMISRYCSGRWGNWKKANVSGRPL